MKCRSEIIAQKVKCWKSVSTNEFNEGDSGYEFNQ